MQVITVKEYTINSANTWNKSSITFPGDTSTGMDHKQ